MHGTLRESPFSEDPSALHEQSRTFMAAGNLRRAISASNDALALSADATPRLREAILKDAALLRLQRKVPGGYAGALDVLSVLDERGLVTDSDGHLYLLRARANGQRYEHLRERGRLANEPELLGLRAKIKSDLSHVMGHRSSVTGGKPYEDVDDDLTRACAEDPLIACRVRSF